MPNECVTIDERPSKCFRISVGRACTKMRIAGERLSMAARVLRQLQSFAAKRTQHGNQRRKILLGQANNGAIRQRQFDPRTGPHRRDRQLQETWRGGRRCGLQRRAARRDERTLLPGALQRDSAGRSRSRCPLTKLPLPDMESLPGDILSSAELGDRQPAGTLSCYQLPPLIPTNLIYGSSHDGVAS